ncbi:MAG: hypothetical protein JWP89_2124 [Schlesneria sp.]|nr:hypothetical protein [Schlesneria sp.]
MVARCLRFLAAALVWATICGSEVWACPMCKFALEADDPQPRAYMYSIFFMLFAIGSIFSAMIGFLIWLSKHERAAMDAAGYQHLFENGVNQPAAEAVTQRS